MGEFWQITVHGIKKSCTQLSKSHFLRAISLDIYLGMKQLVKWYLLAWLWREMPIAFQSSPTTSHSCQQRVRVSVSPHHLQHYHVFLIVTFLVVMKQYLTCILICFSLMINNVSFFMCLLAICMFFEEMTTQVLGQNFNWVMYLNY